MNIAEIQEFLETRSGMEVEFTNGLFGDYFKIGQMPFMWHVDKRFLIKDGVLTEFDDDYMCSDDDSILKVYDANYYSLYLEKPERNLLNLHAIAQYIISKNPDLDSNVNKAQKSSGWQPDEARDDVMEITRKMF